MFDLETMRFRRERLGISKSALAREAKMHVSTVSQIETGRLVPYPAQVAKLEKALTRLEKEAGLE